MADDDPDIRIATATGLGRAGHTVVVCEDGGQLLDTVRASTPDVVVTDNQMPVLTGLHVLTLLRQDPVTTDIPVILATGSVQPGEAELLLGDSDQLLIKRLHRRAAARSRETRLALRRRLAPMPGS